jgi:2-polyprenyl-3-methyl-5-hydroxy-6-metoxy-1,4-benzoquinol methylase
VPTAKTDARTDARTDYALELNDEELARYRLMAEVAACDEAADWAAAGIAPGARVADVGCGPGAILTLLADAVGPAGVAIGVDQDPHAVALASAGLEGRAHASALVGDADATGLAPASFDVVMCRHVLAHNGGREVDIVEHLATLVRPGGSVYLVDVDMTGMQMLPADPALDIVEHYRTFHALRGNDLSVGMRLGLLLEDVGLQVERYRAVSNVWRLPAGVRGPQWAARQPMLDEGVSTPADLDRWAAAFERMDRAAHRPWTFIPVFVAIGRRPR